MATAFALLGPTASGKSALAYRLAEKHPIEIVSVDSAQVYRGMDIGTAKPSAEERARVPHHLIDLVDPDERYSAGQFREDAIRAVQSILKKGKMPLLVGGTMLYHRTLVAGLDPLPKADRELREDITAEAQKRGWPALHADLAKVDPDAARRIMPNDAQRIQRALEVSRLTGEPISALQRGVAPPLPFELRGCALIPDRVELHRNIEARFDSMMRHGLVDEVKALRSRYALDANMPSMRAVGYRQVWAFLEGEIAKEEMRAQAITATRQLAKRQLTWLRSFPNVLLLTVDNFERAATELDAFLR